MKTKTEVLPAGNYYVGDLMYAANESLEWLSDALWTADRGTPHYFTSPDGKYQGCAMRTALGDGVYEDQDEDTYCVDSGSLGAIPVDAVDPEDHEYLKGLGFFIQFDEPFTCHYSDEYGICSFGDINIMTNPENY